MSKYEAGLRICMRWAREHKEFGARGAEVPDSEMRTRGRQWLT